MWGKLQRNWEKWGRANFNQNIFSEKNLLSIKEKRNILIKLLMGKFSHMRIPLPKWLYLLWMWWNTIQHIPNILLMSLSLWWNFMTKSNLGWKKCLWFLHVYIIHCLLLKVVRTESQSRMLWLSCINHQSRWSTTTLSTCQFSRLFSVEIPSSKITLPCIKLI